jgi:hypothetical protein
MIAIDALIEDNWKILAIIAVGAILLIILFISGQEIPGVGLG